MSRHTNRSILRGTSVPLAAHLSRLTSLLALSIAACLTIVPAMAAADDSTPAAEAEVSRESAIAEALAIVDLVLQHHVQSPTRQEMVLQGAVALYDAAGVPRPYDLSRRVSSAAGPEEFEAILQEAWVAGQTAGSEAAARGARLRKGVLQPVPGEPEILATKELRVQEQLQANRYVGIGIALGRSDEWPQMNLMPGGPAALAGALDKDLIESVDGQTTRGLSIEQVVDRLRGPEGSTVTLVLRQPDDGKSRELTIKRGVVPRRTVHGMDGQDFRVQDDRRIAYVSLLEIGGSAVHELRTIERQLDESGGFDAVIIDLQHCRQGSAHDATMLIDAMLDQGTIGAVRTATRCQTLTADADCLFRGRPMAVLVGENTGSTGEWVAASLQDNRRAAIVGARTPGKAFTQSGVAIPGTNKSLLLPTALLERPSQQAPLAPNRLRNAKTEGAEAPDSEVVRGVEPDYAAPEPGTPPIPAAVVVRRQFPYSQIVPSTAAVSPLAKAREVLHGQLKASRPSGNSSGNG